MHKSIPVLISTSLLFLAGCSMTLPVKGQMGNGSETFTGKATGYLDGAGTLVITSNKGRTCKGNFVYISDRHGEGIFHCSNGKSGPFRFVSTGTKGNGSGTIGGKTFTFTFG